MARTRKNVPACCLHKPSGQAIVTLTAAAGNCRNELLGPFGTKESRIE